MSDRLGANMDADSARSKIRRFDSRSATTNEDLEDVIAAGHTHVKMKRSLKIIIICNEEIIDHHRKK